MLMAPVFHPIKDSSPFIDSLIYRVKIGIICWRLSMVLGIDIVDTHFVFEPTLGPFVAIPRRYAHYNAAGHRFVAEQA
jgi:hypothetical protein